MIKIESNQVFSTDGKHIRRKGADTYFMRGIAMPGDTAADYEEAPEIPAYTKAEYDDKVSELVRDCYSESEEFALQRKAINAAFSPSTADAASPALEEFAQYNAYVEECKIRAKRELKNKK